MKGEFAKPCSRCRCYSTPPAGRATGSPQSRSDRYVAQLSVGSPAFGVEQGRDRPANSARNRSRWRMAYSSQPRRRASRSVQSRRISGAVMGQWHSSRGTTLNRRAAAASQSPCRRAPSLHCRDAVDVAGEVHDRMPVFLPASMGEEWMKASADDAMAILLAAEMPPLVLHPFSRKVNDASNRGTPNMIETIDVSADQRSS